MITLSIKATYPPVKYASTEIEEFSFIEQFESAILDACYIMAAKCYPLPRFDCKLEALGYTREGENFSTCFYSRWTTDVRSIANRIS